MTEHVIDYGKNRIKFLLEQKPKKSFKISVLPDLSVGVSAPSQLSIDNILSRVKQRGSWIIKQMDYFKLFLPKQPPRQYVNGETHCYLGRQYLLKVEKGKIQDIKLKGKFIIVRQGNIQKTKVKERLYEWYRLRARCVFESILERCQKRVQKYGIECPSVEIRTMKSRWGSCTPAKGKICLNTELVKAPSHCIEYVIMHELCHLKYRNHNKQFYNFLTLVMPDWQKRKDRLEKVLI